MWQDGQKEPNTLHEAQVLFNKVAKGVGNAALRARTARMSDFRKKHGGPLGRLNEQNYRKVRAERPMRSRIPGSRYSILIASYICAAELGSINRPFS